MGRLSLLHPGKQGSCFHAPAFLRAHATGLPPHWLFGKHRKGVRLAFLWNSRLLAAQASPALRLAGQVAGELVWGLASSKAVPKTPVHCFLCTAGLLLRNTLDPRIGQAPRTCQLSADLGHIQCLEQPSDLLGSTQALSACPQISPLP